MRVRGSVVTIANNSTTKIDCTDCFSSAIKANVKEPITDRNRNKRIASILATTLNIVSIEAIFMLSFSVSLIGGSDEVVSVICIT